MNLEKAHNHLARRIVWHDINEALYPNKSQFWVKIMTTVDAGLFYAELKEI